MNANRKLFASLPPTYIPEIRRHSMSRLFGFCIQETRLRAGLSIEEAARLSGMELSQWMAIEDGNVPQDINELRAMAETLHINFETIASWVLVCRGAWEL